MPIATSDSGLFLAVTTLLTSIFCGPMGIPSTASAAPQPNVVVIITDDQGYGDLSCHGGPLPTPHLDQLARASVRLADFHVAPMCTPTRGQLMTGLDAFRNAACNVSSGRTLLRPDLKTMADHFRAAGYRTGMFGKWHLGDNYPYRPHDRGFDEALWFGSSHIGSAADFWENDYFGDVYWHNSTPRQYDGYCTDIFFREAEKWVSQDSRQPFFAYIALNAPHGPLYVPDEYRQRVRKQLEGHPALADRDPQERRRLVSFLAMIANIDDNIGKFDRFLSEQGLLENTIVVFLTDNGSTFGPRYFNAGMRGGKTTLWEGGHRVPCFIRWPAGDLGESREVEGLTHVQDLLPTLVELATGSAPQDDLDGMSLAPLLRGRQLPLDDRMLVINYSRMPGMKVDYTDQNVAIPHKDGSAVLWKRWRLVENRELYDLASDPMQQRDVAEQHPEIVAKLRDHLDRWWQEVAPHVAEPQRVVIGHERENPTRLTACEWFDVFIDQQTQVRRATRRNGVWHLIVERPGTYTIDVNRFPPEAELKVTDGVSRTKVTDGVLTAGPALPVAKVRIQLGDQSREIEISPGDRSAKCDLQLEAGETTLQTWLLDSEGNEICGAYYAIMTRHD